MAKNPKAKITSQARNELILFLCLVFILTGMTVGFAHYSRLIQVQGVATIKPQGIVRFTEFQLISSSNVDTTYQPSYTDTTLDFNLHFVETDPSAPYSATYQITIQNDTFYSQSFQGMSFAPVIKNGQGTAVDPSTLNITINDISEDDILASESSITFTATLTFVPPDPNESYTVEGDATVDTNTEQSTGSLYASLVGSTTGDLTGDTIRTPFTASIMNTHNTSQTFNFIIGNTSHYKLVDSSGNNLGAITIAANTVENYTFYVERLSTAVFTSTQESTTLSLISSSSERANVGRITLLVDETPYKDTTAPTISDVTLTMVRSVEGQAVVSWNGTDDVAPTGYTVDIYDNSDTKIGNSHHTISDERTMTINNLGTGTYYAKVYGIDAEQNTATEDDILYCSPSAGPCSRSSDVPMQWRFTVRNELTNLTSDGANSALIDSTYTATLFPTGNRRLPDTITVVMNNRTLAQGTGYTYSSSTGAIRIPNVSGNITITATAQGGCLIEGTLVKLADGTEKPVENVTYDDLVLVWSYEEGKVVARHPVWIEKEAETDSYQVTEFDDGTVLKTTAGHGVFSVDLNRFVSVDNRKEFYVGTHIYKLNKDQELEEVEVTKISTIREKVKYYHVVSTEFYNIFANNLLTTDDEVILSNFYGFSENATWSSARAEIIKDKNNLYDYSDFEFMPRWMFDGLRVQEGKYLDRIGILPKEIFIEYLKANQLNPDMFLPKNTEQ